MALGQCRRIRVEIGIAEEAQALGRRQILLRYAAARRTAVFVRVAVQLLMGLMVLQGSISRPAIGVAGAVLEPSIGSGVLAWKSFHNLYSR